MISPTQHNRARLRGIHGTHFNEIQDFYITNMYTLLAINYMTKPHKKHNRHTLPKIRTFQDFNIKPHTLINMHDITNQNNRAYIQVIGHPCTTYHMNQL